MEYHPILYLSWLPVLALALAPGWKSYSSLLAANIAITGWLVFSPPFHTLGPVNISDALILLAAHLGFVFLGLGRGALLVAKSLKGRLSKKPPI